MKNRYRYSHKTINTKRLSFFVLLFSTLILNSCTDFLEVDYKGGSTTDDFYNTRYKLQQSLNATYDILQMEVFNNSDRAFGESCADNVETAGEGGTGEFGQLVRFAFNTSNGWILDRYQVNYKGINRANQVIANAPQVQLANNSNYDEYRQVQEMIGEAKFLRALFYFNLVKTYGGVPIRPETENVDSLVIPRSSASEVYAYIEKDLREAAVSLPGSIAKTEKGRASVGAAVGLLMKVLMYQAKPTVLSEKWEEMATLGEYIIEGKSMTIAEMLNGSQGDEEWEALSQRLWFAPLDVAGVNKYKSLETALPQINNNYSLSPKSTYGETLNYHEIFYQVGEFYSGSIFEIVFAESKDGTTGDNNEGNGFFQPLYNGGMWVSRTAFIKILENDPRYSEVALAFNEITPDGDIVSGRVGVHSIMKYYTAQSDRPLYDGDYSKNRRYLRLAEVVLMYAEALNEIGEGARSLVELNKTKTIANSINNTNILYKAGGYGYMRDQIWKERQLELCFEFDRFFDIVRQGRAATILNSLGLTFVYQRGFFFKEGVNEVFPIPQNEVDLSNGIVSQNPGY